MEISTKIFARRDSATALLRKLGVDSSEYDKYIVRMTTGEYQLSLPIKEEPANPDPTIADEQAIGDQKANAALSDTPPPQEEEGEAASDTEVGAEEGEGGAEEEKEKPASRGRGRAKKPAKTPKAKKAKLAPKAKPIKPAAKIPSGPGRLKNSGDRKPSLAARARELILAGKDNDAVFVVLQREFGISEQKKHYPSWYRSQLKRQGLL
jgi:hypothetical protein